MSYVYVISAGPKRHKIGLSTNPKSRLASLRTASPDDLTLVFVAQTPQARIVEQRAHDALRVARLNGEWFEVPQEVAVAAVCQYLGPDPICPEHRVGDRVRCIGPVERGFPEPHPVVGETYTIECVYPEGAVDLVELPNDSVAFCPSRFVLEQ